MGTSKMIGQRQPRRLPHVGNPTHFYWVQRPLSSPMCSSTCSLLLCLVAQSCPTLCHPMDCSPPGSSVHGGSPGKNTGVGCYALFQGIFPTQGSNPGLPHYRQIFYHELPGKPTFSTRCLYILAIIKVPVQQFQYV